MNTPRPPDDLLAVLARLDAPARIGDLLVDLLTPAEVEALGERWAIVKALAEGHTQRAVRDAVGCSVTTVTRGARQLRYGAGGFGHAFETLRALGLPAPGDAAPGREGGR